MAARSLGGFTSVTVRRGRAQHQHPTLSGRTNQRNPNVRRLALTLKFAVEFGEPNGGFPISIEYGFRELPSMPLLQLLDLMGIKNPLANSISHLHDPMLLAERENDGVLRQSSFRIDLLQTEALPSLIGANILRKIGIRYWFSHIVILIAR